MKKAAIASLLTIALTTTGLNIFGCGVSGNNKAAQNGAQSDAKTDAKSSAAKPLGPAPDVTFKSLDGPDVSLASLKGKVVIVNFWATWCEPCRIEIPWMIDYQKKYADKGFTVLGVAMDEEGASAVAPYVKNEKFDVDGQKVSMNYPILLGNDDLAAKFGGIIGLPTTSVISRDGKVVKRIIGIVSYDELDKLIQELL